MSATPTRHGRTTPLHERSNSQNNRPGIRLVPYSPPRLDEDRAPSQASSRDNAGSRCSGTNTDRRGSNPGHVRRTSWLYEVTDKTPGSALPSPTASAFSLATFKDERVSGVKPEASPSGVEPAGPTAPPLKTPSEVSTEASDRGRGRAATSHADDSSSPASTKSQQPRPLSRRRRLQLSVHSDGTFSLLQDGLEPDAPGSRSRSRSRTASIKSPHLSHASRTPSAQDRPSIDAWSDRRASTLTAESTTILDHSFSELPRSTTSSAASSSTHLAEDPNTSSPWNYRLVGGLRKVPTTPDAKGKQPLYNTSTPTSETFLPPLPEAAAPSDEEDEEEEGDTPTRTVVRKGSFASSNPTVNTVAESTNYKVYGPGSAGSAGSAVSDSTNYKVYGPGSAAQESTDSLVFNATSPSNWDVLGQSSPAPSIPSSSPAVSTNENYIVHGGPSASPSSSLVTVARKPRPAYSHESLAVAPLRPNKKRSHERFGYYKQRSRETLRSRTSSVQSLRSLSSALIGQDPSQAFVGAPVVLSLGSTPAHPALGGDPANIWQRFPWSVPESPGSSSSNPQSAITQRPPASMTQSQPHQWSSQLSTVMSESEGGSDRDPARSVSPLSEATGHRRRSSAGWVSSMHSRQMASISSSMALQIEEAAAASGSEPLEKPQPSFSRAGPSQIRMVVRDQDEHGDGLADLDHKASSTGLSALFANGMSRHLHSNSSSRANSFTSTIPAWAQVYYGSGERRFLGRRPSFLTISESGDSRPSSAGYLGGESPNTDQFPQALFSPRKRAREVQPSPSRHLHPGRASMEISPAPSQDYRIFRTLKEKTSSIWSPHLQRDRRATGYSVWDPPSVSWSADSGIMGKRNAQVVLFIFGFIFPFAWMIAALLPLPASPKLQMFETDSNQSQFGAGHPVSRYQRYLVDETRYESARWWRNLNRVMSIVGLLIIGAVVALAVIGVRQGWGS